MSAFVCSRAHIKALAIFAAQRVRGSGWRVDPRYVKGLPCPEGESLVLLCDDELATLYANVMQSENVRSVNIRYSDDFECEPLRVSDADICRFNLTPVHILKMCACLDYQSCESDDWESTVAYRLLQRIKDSAIDALPGYGAAPWAYDGEKVAA